MTIFDYGAGNLHSLENALATTSVDVVVETDPHRCLDTDVLLLPGVGAFGQAASRLAPAREQIREALCNGLPAIGICLGMQLLFAGSEEAAGAGLDVIPGRVTRLSAARVPHIGWNSIDDACDPLLDRAPLSTAYFANGFVCRPESAECATAWTTHESDRFPAIVRAYRTIGMQFHPEKSSRAGVRLLHAALEECAR